MGVTDPENPLKREVSDSLSLGCLTIWYSNAYKDWQTSGEFILQFLARPQWRSMLKVQPFIFYSFFLRQQDGRSWCCWQHWGLTGWGFAHVLVLSHTNSTIHHLEWSGKQYACLSSPLNNRKASSISSQIPTSQGKYTIWPMGVNSCYCNTNTGNCSRG